MEGGEGLKIAIIHMKKGTFFPTCHMNAFPQLEPESR
jgi:hypothetical protein